MNKQLIGLLSLSLVVILGGCAVHQVEINSQVETELSITTEDNENSGSSESLGSSNDSEGETNSTMVMDFSGITSYIKSNEQELESTEIIYDFGNNPLSNEVYQQQSDKTNQTGIVVDNIDSYKKIDTGSELYEAKLSPNKNKIYIDYKGTDRMGIVTVTKGKESVVYTVEDKEIISLVQGDGEYTIKMYITKDQFNCMYKGKFSIEAENTIDNTAYEGQSYYSNYKPENLDFVAIAEDLWIKSSSVREYIWNCYVYTAQYKYNYDKSTAITSGEIMRYRPDVSELVEEKSGICLDKAAVMASLLRAKDIPAKIVFGYYGKLYHAWVEVGYNDEWLLFDPTLKFNYSNTEANNYSVSRYN